jgi:hypothetical protein
MEKSLSSSAIHFRIKLLQAAAQMQVGYFPFESLMFYVLGTLLMLKLFILDRTECSGFGPVVPQTPSGHGRDNCNSDGQLCPFT